MSETNLKILIQTQGYFYCQPCKFEAMPMHSIDMHLTSDEHLQVVAALNQSVPIVIKKISYCFLCQVCRAKFHLNIQLKHHLLKSHGIFSKSLPTFTCKICKFSCNKQRSLQVFICTLPKNCPKLCKFLASHDRQAQEQAQEKADACFRLRIFLRHVRSELPKQRRRSSAQDATGVQAKDCSPQRN
jgi:hypothetical protein